MLIGDPKGKLSVHTVQLRRMERFNTLLSEIWTMEDGANLDELFSERAFYMAFWWKVLYDLGTN